MQNETTAGSSFQQVSIWQRPEISIQDTESLGLDILFNHAISANVLLLFLPPLEREF